MDSQEKQLIPYKDLLEKVQNLLVNYSECRNIHIDKLDLYQEQINGANWDISSIRRSGDDNDWSECRGKISVEVQHLRDRYDVVKEG